MAIFTLPPEMMYFFKPNIEFYTEHGPDPDKRKYVDKNEAIKHYIDIDQWGEYPFSELPRSWVGVMLNYSEMYAVYGDSKALLFGPKINAKVNDTLFGNNIKCLYQDYNDFIYNKVAYKILNEDIEFPVDSISKWFGIDLSLYNGAVIKVEEHFSKEGIIPYHIYNQYHSLVKSFQQNNAKSIIRKSNDMGHYIADAHVPLHTTKNYNGQLTGQRGIHAFWENRIPELLCDKEFDFLIGKAKYIDDIKGFIWDIVLTSHSLKDEVLKAEKTVSALFHDDKKYAFIERNGVLSRIQSEEYTRAYDKEMNGMVEMRMRDAAKALGDIWYTAWIDAGQPDLKSLGDVNWTKKELEEMKKLNKAVKTEKMHGRDHWD